MNSVRQTPVSRRQGKRGSHSALGAIRATSWRSGLLRLGAAAAASGFVACGSDETQVVGGVASNEPAPPASNEPPPDSSFQKVTLNGAPGEPIALVVLPDGRVLHTTRNGRIFLHDPATGFNRVTATIPVYQHDEEGLQGIAVDADFAKNHWLYVYYSPPLATPSDDPATPDFNEGDAPLN